MPSTADLYTTVVNTSGKTLTFSYLGKHGKTLAANGQMTVWGHIQHSLGHGEIGIRKRKALERDILAGKLEIKTTPKSVFYNVAEALSSTVSPSSVALTSNVVTVTTATPHKLVKAQYTSTTKALTSNVAKITVGGNHQIVPGDKVIVALTTPDAVFDGCQLVTAVDSTSFYFAKTNADVASASGAGTVKVVPRYVQLASFTAATNTAAVEALNGVQEVTDVTSDVAFKFAKTASNITSTNTTAGSVNTKVTPSPVAAITGTGNNAGTNSNFPAKTFGFACTFVNKYGETAIGTSPVAVAVTANNVVQLTLPIFPPGSRANVYMTDAYNDSTAYNASGAATDYSKWRAVAINVPNNTNPLATSVVVSLTQYTYYDSATYASATIVPPATNLATPTTVTSLQLYKDGTLGTIDPSYGKQTTVLGS